MVNSYDLPEPPLSHGWVFPARLDRVVDGDTVDMLVDIGFRARFEVRVRLAGVDTAEIYGVKHDTEEYARGTEHADFVQDWFAANASSLRWPYLLATRKDSGKYGRWPGIVEAQATGAVLNDDLIAEYPEVVD